MDNGTQINKGAKTPMKKIVAAVFALSLTSSAMAAVGVDFGTNWYKVSYTDNVGDHLFGQGQNFLVSWTLDNGLTLGSYTESGVWTYYSGSADEWELTAIRIGKDVVKNVSIATNIGRMFEAWNDEEHTLIDVLATVTLVGGTSSQISGALKFTIGGRYTSKLDPDYYDFSGFTSGLSVGLSF
jgi:hypothetical protein